MATQLWDIYDEVRAERARAHQKHGNTSMEAFPVDDMNRLPILVEEVGEAAKEFNEARHAGGPVDLARLRKELIQTATMAAAWADAICWGCKGTKLDSSGANWCQDCGGDGYMPTEWSEVGT